MEDGSKEDQAVLLPNYPQALSNRLFDACVEADWATVDTLCDDFTDELQMKDGGKNKLDVDWSSDSDITTVLHALCKQNNRCNPLMAAVLHVAIDVAAAHKSCTLFSDIVSQELLDVEERKRLQSSGIMSFDNPLTTQDFCPYAMMRKYADDTYPEITEEERQLRRKAIAKLCRANPLWIIMPMLPRSRTKYDDEQTNFDDDLPRGTTPLHVAVRSRNVTLTKLLIKYCPKSAEVADLDGCIALHYAVRPSDEATVLRRAVLTYQRSLNGGADNAPLESGPNEVHSGANLYYHGKLLFKATHESSELARCRVRRLRRKYQLRTMKSNVDRANSLKRDSTMAGKGKSKEESNSTTQPIRKGGGQKTKSASGKGPDSKKKEANKKTNSLKNDGGSTGKKECFPDMYDTPSLLVRAMMSLGTIEEDATDYVQSEWVTMDDPTNAGLKARKAVITRDYPIVLDSTRSITRGLGRATRPWKTAQHRFDMIKLLTKAHPQGMLYQCDDGGDTPLILACQTLEGDDGEDDEFGDLLDDELDGEQAEDAAAAGNNQNAPAPDEIGEDAADYEEDLPPRPEDDAQRGSIPNAAAVAPAHGEPLENRESGSDQADNANQGEHNDHVNPEAGQPQQEQQQEPGPNDEEDDPLEAVFFMISENGLNAMGVADDDGDTALHAAVRIGASPRLVQRLLDTLPALASTPAEDGSTPLHLACRRACHLAPEGNGGMGTYDAPIVRALADAAGPGALIASDDEGRTPFHVACRYRASPAVLAELADAEGGVDSLLVRDTDGNTPLGVYCKHATDYHGLRCLVERCPDAAAGVGEGGQLPIHRLLATFNLAVNVDCLILLGSWYPRGLDIKDSRGMTPLALLCESYQGPLNVDIPKLRDGRTTLERCLSNKIWLMAEYLVGAARTNKKWEKQEKERTGDTEREDFLVGELSLHATLREPSSSAEIVELATIINESEIEKADSNGDFPLHLCCRRKHSADSKNETAEDNDENAAGDNDDVSLDTFDDEGSIFKRANDEELMKNSEERSPGENGGDAPQRQLRPYNPDQGYLPILLTILQCDKSAASRCNKEGKYPLNLLIDKGSSWREGGVEPVLKAYPHALFSYEMNNGVFAMALARAASYDDSDQNRDSLVKKQACSIGATFQLLRGKPTALEFASAGTHPINNRKAVRRSPRSKKRKLT